MTPAVDVLVVGAGPIGIETALTLQQAGLEVLVVDAGPVGATILRTFPPHTRWFSSPERLQIRGYPLTPVAQEKVTGEEYLAYLRSVVTAAGVRVATYTQVVAVAGSAGDFRVTVRTPTGVERILRAATLVLATGGTDQPRRLRVPGEELPHVHRHLGDPHRFFGRRVLVVGGRNSAAESAVRLYRVGADVSLSYRRADIADNVKFWIRPELRALLAEGAITGYLPSTVTEITGAGVSLTDGRFVPVDDVLLQLGFEQDQTLFDEIGIQTDGSAAAAPVFDPATMRTEVPGVFIVGTATAGTQDRFAVFVENCHQHADRVLAALTDGPPPAPVPPRPLPEA